MSRQYRRLSGLLGAALGALMLAGGAQAHECHALGQPKNDSIGQYWVCAGFTFEDGFRPRAGTLNNLDFIPIWVGPAGQPDENIDTRQGDIVSVEATLVRLEGRYYSVPVDPNDPERRATDPNFFFKTLGVGFSSPAATSQPFFRVFTNLKPFDVDDEGETVVMYRSPWNFVTPYAGNYAWIIKGALKRKGHPLVFFSEKFVSQQPRIPYGPWVVDGSNLSDFAAAPEGWFDSVRPANAPAQALARSASSTPRALKIVARHKKR